MLLFNAPTAPQTHVTYGKKEAYQAIQPPYLHWMQDSRFLTLALFVEEIMFKRD
jgi:hypothetical protein